MPSTTVTLTHGNTFLTRGRQKTALLRRFINLAMGVVGGSERGGGFDIVTSATDPAAANGALISASGTGTVGAVINGVTVTDTWATSDTVSAGLVAVAINASTNALVQHVVRATNLKTVVTLASVLAGTTINLAGFVFTAVTAATGNNGTLHKGDFDISGSDTADAAALAIAINSHPAASRFLGAIPIAGAVHVFPKSVAWFSGPNAPPNVVTASAATVTVGSATFAASAYCCVWATHRTKWGNHITFTATGTGQTISGSATRLLRGLGEDAARISDTI